MGEVEVKGILSSKLGFSIESLRKLDKFVHGLLKYNLKYNLISKNTVKDVWSRHVLDSAQLVKFIDFNIDHSLIDLGSGGGFPGMILAIFNNNPNFHVKLMEKSPVKSKFLIDISNSLEIKCEVQQNSYKSHIIDSEYIVARAFKKLPEIMSISREIATKSHKLIILKGKNAQKEINIAFKKYVFKYKLETSMTNKESKIILVDVIKK